MGMLEQNNRAPTAQLAPQDGQTDGYGDGDWLKRAQDAYRDSTSYMDNNFRKMWDDSIRAFNNQHAADSKYNMAAYDKRSKLYRPKTRSIIRKNEAAAAAAFFSNMETTNVTPVDQSNKVEAASAMVMKELLQYRLTKSIPWYQIVLGGLQDAQVTGVACAHVHWDFEQEKSEEDAAESETLTLGASEMSNEYPAQAESMLPEGADIVTPVGVKSAEEAGEENDQETPWQVALSAIGDPLEPPSQDEYKDYGPEMPAVVLATAKNPPPKAKPKVDNWFRPEKRFDRFLHVRAGSTSRAHIHPN